MTSTPTAVDALRRARSRDTADRRKRVARAITHLERAGAALTISGVARTAGVHRSFIHRHPDLAAAIRSATPSTSPPETNVTERASLHAELANAHAANRRQAIQIRALERQLSELLGQQVALDAGLVPADVDPTVLGDRIQELEQTVTDLRRELAERDDDLAAARATNRAFARRPH